MPRSDDLGTVVHWFLKPTGDFRSSNALETPLSEFVCQGLEIDYAGLCWGNDLTWDGEAWMPRKMRAPNWQLLRKDAEQQYRINTYRVLLTRGRAGTVIYVPVGDETDSTRKPKDFDAIFDVLVASGCPSCDDDCVTINDRSKSSRIMIRTKVSPILLLATPNLAIVAGPTFQVAGQRLSYPLELKSK